MREKFATSSINFILKYNAISDYDLIKINYGLQVLYTILTKTIGIIIINIFLKTINEALYLMFIYSALRLFEHGIHAKKSSECWIASIIFYTIFPLTIKYCIIPSLFIYITFIFSFIVALIYAPADTKQKPIINKKRRFIYKIITLLILIILFLITINSNNIKINNSICLAMIMSTIAINPITYKIFNTSYNNYKKV